MAKKAEQTLKEIVSQYKKDQDGVVETASYDPARQVEGYKERIEGSGLDAEKETDSRNILERALNLTPDQNVLFDIFEVIGRPQQAIFGGIKASQEGKDGFKGALEGLSGDRRTQFKEITNEAGVTEDSGDKFGFDDVLGFAGDVFLDPADLAILPISASAKAAKAAKAMKAIDAAKAAKVGETAVAVDKAAKAARSMKNSQSFTEMVFKGIGTGFKKTVSLADTGAEKLFKSLDGSTEALLRSQGKEFVAEKMGTLHKYRNIKDSLKSTFDYASGLGESVFSKVRKYKGKAQYVEKQQLLALNDYYMPKINASISDLSAKSGFSEKEVEEFLAVIFENGAETFDKTGKLTRKGQQHSSTIYNILTTDAWAVNTGLDLATKDKVTGFLDTFFPKLKDEVNKTLSTSQQIDDFFMKFTDETGTIKDVYRINPKAKDAIEGKMKKLQGVEGAESYIIDNGRVRVLDDKELEERRWLKEELKDLEESVKNGGKRALKQGSESSNTLMKLRNSSDEAAHEIRLLKRQKTSKALKKKYNITEGMSVEDANAIKLKAIRDLDKQISKNERKIKKLFSKTNPDSEDINVLLDQVRTKLQPYETVKDVQDVMYEKFVIDNYLSDAMKSKLEKFAETEGVEEALNSIGGFMTETEGMLQEILESTIHLTDGYLSHSLTDSWAKISLDKIDGTADRVRKWGSTRDIIGDSQVLAARKYRLSTLESNATAKTYAEYLKQTLPKIDPDGEIAKRLDYAKITDMFATDINSSLSDFMLKSTRATEDGKILEAILASDIFADGLKYEDHYDVRSFGDAIKGVNERPSKPFVRKFVKGDKAPVGYTRFETASLQKKLESMSTYIGNDDLRKTIENSLKSFPEGQLYLDNNIAHLINISRDDQSQKTLLNLVDGMNNFFKKNKLLSPGFQMRNIVGNLSNMMLSGIPIRKIGEYTRESNKIIKEGEQIFKDIATKVLTVDDLTDVQRKIYSEYSEFIEHGFGELGNALHDIPEEKWNINAQRNHWEQYKSRKAKNPNTKATTMELASFPKDKYNKLVAWNMAKNQAQDGVFRMTAWRYAKDHPEFLEKYGHESAESYVRKTLFDFQDLSVNERDTLRKIIPFYTFTKKNLGFQLRNITENSVKYNRMVKSFENMWGNLNLEDNELDRFKLENFWIPIPYIGKDGKYKAIKSSLPLGDLGEFLENPLQRTLASTAPYIRAPFEIGANTQMFSGMPIQEFKGQEGYYIPELGRRGEYALSQAGLDVPATLGMDIGRTVTDVVKGNLTNPFSIAENALGRTVISTGDPARTATREAYNELDDLQNLMRYYKQEDIEIKTLDEIENSNLLGNTKNIIARLREINSR